MRFPVRRRVPSEGTAPARIAIGDVALALVSYIPLILTHSGSLGADTKAYLYLDPGKLLSKAPYLWDSSVGLGTVTHQNIGYLLPMGPYYWFMQLIGCPDWLAQRLWMGSIIFLAGIGVRYLLRILRWEGPGITVAAFAYALSPYIVHYIYKHSVILLPFSALPWLIAFCARSLRERGWRNPALFALTALMSGGVNATSLLLVLIGPGLWIIHAIYVERELTVRAALAPIAKISVLTLATSLWWMAGLSMQGRYGIDVLRFTETYKTVADSSSATEVGRSMGYWFLYGIDNFGPWFRVVERYTRSLPSLTLSFAIPTICVAFALWTRFRYRIFFVGIVLAGMVVSVGAHPWSDPSPYGRLFKAFTTTSSGLALRSTPRAIPLVALGLAVFGGAGIAALTRVLPRYRLGYATVALGLIALNMFPMFTGKLIDPSFERPNDVPQYWVDAGEYLNTGDRNTRTLEVPGIDFANYRWGASVDPITPGLTDRDYAAHELVPYGSDESANLMNAVDGPIQTNTFDPAAWAPLMRMMGVGDVTLRSDLEYERYRIERPKPLYRNLNSASGLGTPATFGPTTPNVARKEFPLQDEFELSIPRTDADPHAVTIYPVDDPLGMIRTVPSATPTIVAGDANGLVGMAEAGVLDPSRLIVYSGSVSNDAKKLDQLLAQKPQLVITDSNTRSGRRWGNSKDNDGFIEPADSPKDDDLTDNRLDLFGGRGSDVQTVAKFKGPFSVSASGYGNPLNYTPGDRAALAVDGDRTTEWKANAYGDVNGQWIELASPTKITPHTLDLVQANIGVNRYITKIRVTFDSAPPLTVRLDDRSIKAVQRVELGNRSFKKLRITVLDSNRGVVPTPHGLSGVGFAEITVGKLGPVTEVIRPPVDLLDAVGERSSKLPLGFVFRRRIAPPDTGAANQELKIVREMTVPTDRSFTISGKIRLDGRAAPDVLDNLVGTGAWQMTSSSSLLGILSTRASAAFDGDTTTAWQSRMVPEYPEKKQWIQLASSHPRQLTFSSMRVMTDGLHSVPTKIHFEVDGVATPAIELPKTRDGKKGTTSLMSFAPVTLTGSSIRLVIDEIREVTVSYVEQSVPVIMPLSIAELATNEAATGVGQISITSPATIGTCRSDLLSIDDVPVPIRIEATATDREELLRGTLFKFRQCNPAKVQLTKGNHVLSGVDGRATGIDLDQIAAMSGSPTPQATTASPNVRVSAKGRSRYDVTTTSASTSKVPYWLILGQTHNAGWKLTANGVDLGEPTLVNGFANGWRIDPAKVGSNPKFHLEWAPQRVVWVSLALSLVGLLACVVLVIRRPKSAATAPMSTVTATRPEFIEPFDAFGQPPRTLTTVFATLGAALGTGLFVGPWWAPASAVLMFLALTTKRGWQILRVLSLGAIASASLFVIVQQWKFRYRLGGDWPQHFSDATPLEMFGYALLGIECTVEALRAGWRRAVDFESSSIN